MYIMYKYCIMEEGIAKLAGYFLLNKFLKFVILLK